MAAQLSLTETAACAPTMPLQFASAATVILAGQVILGGVTSFKVTVKVQLAVFPLPSSAVSVIVSTSLCPLSTVLEAGLCVMVGLAVQLSLTAAGACDPTTPAQLASAATVVLAGQVILGGVTSFKVTVKVQLAVLPLPSLAVRVTVCTKLCPLSTVVETGLCVTVGFGLQLSLTEVAA